VGGGGCQSTGTLAKSGQKTGDFKYFQHSLTHLKNIVTAQQQNHPNYSWVKTK